MHEADEPDAFVDFLNSDCLASQTGAEIDLLAIETKATAVRDDYGFVVKRVLGLADAAVLAS